LELIEGGYQRRKQQWDSIEDFFWIEWHKTGTTEGAFDILSRKSKVVRFDKGG
jgi:hypothetical protein